MPLMAEFSKNSNAYANDVSTDQSVAGSQGAGALYESLHDWCHSASPKHCNTNNQLSIRVANQLRAKSLFSDLATSVKIWRHLLIALNLPQKVHWVDHCE